MTVKLKLNLKMFSGSKLQVIRKDDYNKFQVMIRNRIGKEVEDQNCFFIWECFKQTLTNIQSIGFKEKH